MTAATISLRKIIASLDRDGAEHPGKELSKLWHEGRLALWSNKTERRPGAACEVVDHGVKPIDPATASAFTEAWDHELGTAWWRAADGTLFHLTNIHAKSAEFASILNRHAKPGRKSKKETHIADAVEIISAATGEVTLDGVAQLVADIYGEGPGHSVKTVTEHIRETVRTHRLGKRKG